jgi:hypothetical protein
MSHALQLSPNRKPGLDILRLFAATLIFLQHSLSSCHLDAWIDIGGLRVGRIGTSLFFMLAGFLASSSSRKPVTWFCERLKVLYPPFWLVTIAGFLLAALTHFKRFDTWQVICQMSGLGYFTHGEAIVNVATWFMSPLLILYLIAMLARLFHPTWVGAAAAVSIAAAAFVQTGYSGTIECHAVTFLSAFLIAQVSNSTRSRLAVAASILMYAGGLFQPEFRYGAISMLLLAASDSVHETYAAATTFTGIAYEWFLVHGLCITLITRQTHTFYIAIPAAAVISLLGALCLKNAVRIMKRCVSLNSASAPTPVDSLGGPRLTC